MEGIWPKYEFWESFMMDMFWTEEMNGTKFGPERVSGDNSNPVYTLIGFIVSGSCCNLLQSDIKLITFNNVWRQFHLLDPSV